MPTASTFATPLLVVLATLAGCSRVQGPAESQVAARVNKGEISIHQVQAVLQKQPRLIAATGGAAAGRVLDVLVEQELAAQAARERGLDSTPAVIQSLEAVRRETLARAFHDSVAAKVATPTSDEVDRYYEAHPELFAQRRLYILQETGVEAAPPRVVMLTPLLAATQGVDDLARVLRDSGVPHSSRAIAQAAEDLPQLVLASVFKLNPGQSVLLPQSGGARIYTLLQAQRVPVERRAAVNAITGFLVAERRRQAVSEAMDVVRKAAKVEYLGTFAPGAASAPTPR